jgi:hypothetical protein
MHVEVGRSKTMKVESINYYDRYVQLNVFEWSQGNAKVEIFFNISFLHYVVYQILITIDLVSLQKNWGLVTCQF